MSKKMESSLKRLLNIMSVKKFKRVFQLDIKTIKKINKMAAGIRIFKENK